MHLRVTRFQGAQKIFVVADLQVRVQAALEQNAGAAEFQHFVDFFVDVLEGKNVAVLGAERAVEGAEGTILGAEIGVVDVAVDLVGDDTGIVFFQTHFVRGHAEAHEIIGFEHFESLLFGQSQEFSLVRCKLNCNQCTLRTRIYDLAKWGAACCAPTTSTLAQAMGLAWGIRPSFAAWVKYSSRPRRFSSSREKSMLSRRYDSSLSAGNSSSRAAAELISAMCDIPKSREAWKSATTSGVAMLRRADQTARTAGRPVMTRHCSTISKTKSRCAGDATPAFSAFHIHPAIGGLWGVFCEP